MHILCVYQLHLLSSNTSLKYPTTFLSHLHVTRTLKSFLTTSRIFLPKEYLNHLLLNMVNESCFTHFPPSTVRVLSLSVLACQKVQRKTQKGKKSEANQKFKIKSNGLCVSRFTANGQCFSCTSE